jgi:hypothetical protein
MLLEDGPLAHFQICSKSVSSSIVDCVVFGRRLILSWDPRLAIRGRPAFGQNGGVTYQTEQMSKRASAERFFFSTHFAAFLFS